MPRQAMKQVLFVSALPCENDLPGHLRLYKADFLGRPFYDKIKFLQVQHAEHKPTLSDPSRRD